MPAGVAQVPEGSLDEAEAYLKRLVDIADDPEMAATRLWETTPRPRSSPSLERS
jgi:hypothetical protein